MTCTGKVIIVSGPSGAGKSTLVRQLLAKSRLPLYLSVSATTRPPRPGEQEGMDYYFLSPEEFHRRRVAGEFLESFEVFGRGYWYGTLRSEVCSGLQQGKWVILEIDVQGMLAVIQEYPDAITLFVRPSSLEELERRLKSRGSDSAEAIQRRLQVARQEWRFKDRYRYEIINDSLDQAVQQMTQILEAAVQ